MVKIIHLSLWGTCIICERCQRLTCVESTERYTQLLRLNSSLLEMTCPWCIIHDAVNPIISGSVMQVKVGVPAVLFSWFASRRRLLGMYLSINTVVYIQKAWAIVYKRICSGGDRHP